MMKLEKQTAAEVLPDQGSGEETDENLPLFPTPSVEPVQEDWRDFDWNTSPAVILHDQAATAAYFNPDGGLVIRQRDTLGAAECFVVIEAENIQPFLAGFRARVKAGLDE